MKLNRMIHPHEIHVNDLGEVELRNKNGFLITEPFKARSLSQDKLRAFAYDSTAMAKDKKGLVNRVWLYELDQDVSNPEYLLKLKQLGELNLK